MTDGRNLTTIAISKETRKRIHKLIEYNESIDNFLNKIMDIYSGKE